MPQTRSLQEVVVAIHFAGTLPITLTDLADWTRAYGGAEPAFQLLPHLPAAQMPAHSQQMPPIDLQLLTATASSLPRVRLRGSDKQTLYVLQDDRVAFGWQRDVELGEEADYPGYEALRGLWADEIARFAKWLLEHLSASFVPRLVELSYSNAYPLEVGGEKRRIGEILKILTPAYHRQVTSFQVAWSEAVGSPGEAVVTAQAGLGSVPPGGLRVLGTNYLGLADISGRTHSADISETVLTAADMLHGRILEIHRLAINSDD